MTTEERDPVILAVDPGSEKCGMAVLTLAGQVAALRVLARSELPAAVGQVASHHTLAALLVGDRTASAEVLAQLQGLGLDTTPQPVPEHNTTLRARERYFVDNPPRGWRRLIPRGMLLPPRPVDDYAALVMAEDWLARRDGPA